MAADWWRCEACGSRNLGAACSDCGAAPPGAPAPQAAGERPAEPRPAGQGEYRVKQGDCLESIAYEHGHFWETVWDDSHNEALRQARKSPNVLLPGDRVVIPRRRPKKDPRPVDRRHRFRRRGVPSRLRVQMLFMEQPRSNESFRLDVAGETIEGMTDNDGWIDVPISPDARAARLTVGEGESMTEHHLQLGHALPVAHTAGAQQRLVNLGFDCPVDGDVGPETQAAVAAFQAQHGLQVTEQLDDVTRAKLEQAHGS